MVCSGLACATVEQLFPLTSWGGDPDGSLLTKEETQKFTRTVRWGGQDEGGDKFGFVLLNATTPAQGCARKEA